MGKGKKGVLGVCEARAACLRRPREEGKSTCTWLWPVDSDRRLDCITGSYGESEGVEEAESSRFPSCLVHIIFTRNVYANGASEPAIPWKPLPAQIKQLQTHEESNQKPCRCVLCQTSHPESGPSSIVSRPPPPSLQPALCRPDVTTAAALKPNTGRTREGI